MTERRNWRNFLGLAVALAILAACGGGSEPAEEADDGRFRKYAAGIAAHHLCSGTFVVGRVTERSPETVLAGDIAPFVGFAWQDDFEWDVDMEAMSATVWAADVAPRTAKYHGDQGCTLLEDGADSVRFTPVAVPRDQPPADEQDWPLGDIGAEEPDQTGVDRAALDAALDAAMGTEEQNTRALAVVRHGKIVGERYAPGFTRNTPQISWSEGKSVTATLIGVLMQKGHFGLDDPAPVAEWRAEGDPRGVILMRHLLTMSSGLDMTNLGLDGASSLDPRERAHARLFRRAQRLRARFGAALRHPAGHRVPLPELRPAHSRADRPGDRRDGRQGIPHPPAADALRPHRIPRLRARARPLGQLHPERLRVRKRRRLDALRAPAPLGRRLRGRPHPARRLVGVREQPLPGREGGRIWRSLVAEPRRTPPGHPVRRLLGLGVHGTDHHGDPVPGRGDRPPRPESGGLRPLPERHGFRDSGRLRTGSRRIEFRGRDAR